MNDVIFEADIECEIDLYNNALACLERTSLNGHHHVNSSRYGICAMAFDDEQSSLKGFPRNRSNASLIDIMQLTSSPHVSRCETNSGRKAGYYAAILSSQKWPWYMESKYSKAVCELLSHQCRK